MIYVHADNSITFIHSKRHNTEYKHYLIFNVQLVTSRSTNHLEVVKLNFICSEIVELIALITVCRLLK